MPEIKWNYAIRPNGEREPYGLVSDCERFRIGKYVMASGTRYRLWDGSMPVGIYGSAKDAQKIALDISRI